MLRPRELKFISILLGLTGLLLLAGGLFNAYHSSLRPWLTGVPYENSGATLAAVRRRGHLRCGVEGSLRGFSVIEGTSIFEEHGRKFFADARGFDADFCRVIAVAVFGTTVDRVYFTPADVVERFDLVREGTVDVLIRNTTWTAMRDTLQGIDFGPVIFHDGQKFLVPGWANDLRPAGDHHAAQRSGRTR